MADKFIDLHSKILHYSKIDVYIAFDDKMNHGFKHLEYVNYFIIQILKKQLEIMLIKKIENH